MDKAEVVDLQQRATSHLRIVKYVSRGNLISSDEKGLTKHTEDILDVVSTCGSQESHWEQQRLLVVLESLGAYEDMFLLVLRHIG